MVLKVYGGFIAQGFPLGLSCSKASRVFGFIALTVCSGFKGLIIAKMGLDVVCRVSVLWECSWRVGSKEGHVGAEMGSRREAHWVHVGCVHLVAEVMANSTIACGVC